MVYHIVISHHQTENIIKFPSDSIFVFDDLTDEDTKVCLANNIPYVTVSQAGNRSINRNTGLKYLFEHYNLTDNDIIEFFDGDRYPIEYNLPRVKQIMDSNDIDIVLYSCQNDTRQSKIFVPLSGVTIIDTGTLCNPFYSCGFCIKVAAINKIMAFNNNNFFEPSFIYWGGEDQYMGLICDKLNIKVALTNEVLLNGKVGGDQEIHANYMETMQNYINLIRLHDLPIRNEPKEYYVLN